MTPTTVEELEKRAALILDDVIKMQQSLDNCSRSYEGAGLTPPSEELKRSTLIGNIKRQLITVYGMACYNTEQSIFGAPWEYELGVMEREHLTAMSADGWEMCGQYGSNNQRLIWRRRKIEKPTEVKNAG